MSLKLISALWDLDIDGPEREVLSALCFYADDDGMNCYPGIALLKWKLGKSESQTLRLLRRLEAREIIKIVERGNGRGNNSEYILDLSKINSKEDCPQKKVGIQRTKVAIEGAKVGIQENKGRHPEHERVASSTGTEIADSKVFILPKKEDPKEGPLSETRARETRGSPFSFPQSSTATDSAWTETGTIVKWIDDNAGNIILTAGPYAYGLMQGRFRDVSKPIEAEIYKAWILNCFEDLGPPGSFQEFDHWDMQVNTCLKKSRKTGRYCSPKQQGNGANGNGRYKTKTEQHDDEIDALAEHFASRNRGIDNH